MRTYDPKVSVKLVKAVRREAIIESMPVVAERYGSQFDGIDLTNWLGDAGGVRLSKGVREPAGGFAVTLCDNKHPAFLESLYALIEPMDMIEIRMAHDPVEYAKAEKGYALPVVMRGFVSDVRRSESVGNDGRPMRTVQISGQDYGKVLQILQIFYLYNSAIGDNLLTGFSLFEKFGIDAKIVSAADFVQTLLDKVINPYMTDLVGLTKGASIGVDVVDSFDLDCSIEGTVRPLGVQNFSGGSVYQLISQFTDVGAFNELFVEERERSVALVLRPCPFEGPDGMPIQPGIVAEELTIPHDWVVAMDVSRSDAGVANYYWVGNGAFAFHTNGEMKLQAQTGSNGDYLLFDYPNSAKQFYGVRMMSVESALSGPDMLNGDGPSEAVVNGQRQVFAHWLDNRRRVLAMTNRDNVLFESGTLRLHGSERIKAGMYLNIERGDFKTRCYVTRVDHEFMPFGGFFTTVSFERGTGFIQRAMLPKGKVAYSQEIDRDGVFGEVGKYA